MCRGVWRRKLGTVTTTETLDPAPAPDFTPPRRLRRSRTGRVGAGVAAGLGDYFAVDPVLFRVFFATSAFFGGAGIIAYLLAWAAIPEDGTGHAAIDGWTAALRRRRVPLWAVVAAAGFALWLVAFSWWAPGPFLPVVIFLAVVTLLVTRRRTRAALGTTGPAATPRPTVDLRKGTDSPAVAGADETTAGTTAEATAGPDDRVPAWARDARAWVGEARVAARERRRRARPIRMAVLIALVATFTALGVADGVSGIPLQSYLWAGLGIVGAGLLVGIVARRTPVSLVVPLVIFAAGAAGLAGSHAGFRDGVGQRVWRPATVPAAHYRLALGQAVVDLRALPPQTSARRVDVELGAGQVRVLLPRSTRVIVEAHVRIGAVVVDAPQDETNFSARGISATRTVPAATGTTGAPVTVDVHVASGQVSVEHDD